MSPSIAPKAPIPSNGTSQGLNESIEAIFGLKPPFDEWLEEEAVEPEIIVERVQNLADEAMAAKLGEVDPERWNDVEKQILIQTLDHQLEGASRDARRIAPGDPPPELCAEEADRRI